MGGWFVPVANARGGGRGGRSRARGRGKMFRRGDGLLRDGEQPTRPGKERGPREKACIRSLARLAKPGRDTGGFCTAADGHRHSKHAAPLRPGCSAWPCVRLLCDSAAREGPRFRNARWPSAHGGGRAAESLGLDACWSWASPALAFQVPRPDPWARSEGETGKSTVMRTPHVPCLHHARGFTDSPEALAACKARGAARMASVAAAGPSNTPLFACSRVPGPRWSRGKEKQSKARKPAQ